MCSEKFIKRIKELRKLMAHYAVHAYIVPGTDAHQNEYIPCMWKRREWVSGFSGSYGDVVITLKQAGLWTDSRYYIQAALELKGTGIELHRLGLPGTKRIAEWLKDELSPDEVIGMDPALFSKERVQDLKKCVGMKNIKLKYIGRNLVDLLWKDRPSFPKNKAEVHPLSFCGEPYLEKLARLREKMEEEDCGFHVITTLDSIAWLLNIRGRDIAYNPLLIAYVIVSKKEVKLFTLPEKITGAVQKHFNGHVKIFDYYDFNNHLLLHAKEENRAWIDNKRTSYDIIKLIKPFCKIYYKDSPVIYFKSVKNRTEIDCLKNVHIRDGAAIVKFLYWLERAVSDENITELSAEKKLEDMRRMNEHFVGPSFKTISAYGDHGAIVHYSSSEKTDRPLKGTGLFLVDSGAQYLDGTTDITRTIVIGPPTDEQKEMYTRVLKGHVALSMTVFPKGTKGIQLDVLARKPLWDSRCDYGHGTGHGVGFFLNVHEGPHSISHAKGTLVDLIPGMLCTIEPGYYKTNEYGIRIENIVLVAGDTEEADEESLLFYYFKSLTLCPYDIKLIEPSLLNNEEREFINSYHKKVREKLSPFLDHDCIRWLEKATVPV